MLRDQGAVISISHPFDLTRGANWSPGTLESLAQKIDAIEVFNARCWNGRPNREAAVFALPAWPSRHGGF